jgi:hypothetical protein
MTKLSTKYVEDNAITEAKILLGNNLFLRGRNDLNTADVDILKINDADKIEFAAFPQKTGTPANNDDLVNKSYVDGKVSTSTIGVPTDGTYTDGLLTFTSATLTADAVDDINETLKYLAPAQGYLLSDIDGTPDFTMSGTTVFSTPKIVGSTANPLTGVAYEATDTNGGSRTDIINDRTFTLTTPDISSWGWRSADTGTFTLKLNGAGIGTVNLAANFNEANRSIAQTSTPWSNGSLAITSVAPTNSFPKWQDGTAQGTFTASNVISGYNYISMEHAAGSTISTSTKKYWYSAETAPVASNAVLGSIGGITTKYLSGVRFYASGSYDSIGVDVDNPYGTTYPAQDMAITSTILTSINVNTPLPTIVAGSVTNVPHNITAQSAVISAGKRVGLGETLSILCTPKTNYGNNGTTTTASVGNILVDTVAASASNTIEYFDDETKRYTSDTNFDTLVFSPNWDSSLGLIAGGSGYSDGLQVYGGVLKYPSQNFSTITAPAAGPDYSGASGRRVYIREFKNPGIGNQNFTLKLFGINASALSATTGSGIFVEIAAPTQTEDGSANFEFKDALRAYTTDSAIGCVDGSLPSGADPQWNLTIGTKSTANSANTIIVRISYPAASVAQITQSTFTFVS